MAIRSERLVTTAINQRVQFSAATLMVRHLVLSVLSPNGGRVAVGDEGADAGLVTQQGILFNAPAGVNPPPFAVGNQDPWDLSQLYLYASTLGDGISWTGDVVRAG